MLDLLRKSPIGQALRLIETRFFNTQKEKQGFQPPEGYITQLKPRGNFIQHYLSRNLDGVPFGSTEHNSETTYSFGGEGDDLEGVNEQERYPAFIPPHSATSSYTQKENSNCIAPNLLPLAPKRHLMVSLSTGIRLIIQPTLENGYMPNENLFSSSFVFTPRRCIARAPFMPLRKRRSSSNLVSILLL